MSEREMSEQGAQFAIGALVKGDARDAIHIAVVPVVAAEDLRPGQRIGFAEQYSKEKVRGSTAALGIVDPFLVRPVRRGERFFMFMLPNTITGLRHQWTHPAFDTNSESEAWLRDFAVRLDADYDRMIAGAVNGDGYCFSNDIDYNDFDSGSEFWRHIEAVTGQSLDETHKSNTSFRCAC